MKGFARKASSIVIATVMVLSNVIPAFAAPSTFTDTQDHWAKEQIQATSEKGFMGGYPDGTFKPNESVDYGMTITVMDRVFSQFDERYSKAFSQEGLDRFGDDLDYLLDYLTYLQKETMENFHELPKEMQAYAKGLIEALDKDINNFEDFKAKYAFTIDKDFAGAGRQAYFNDLKAYKYYWDNFDTSYKLIEDHRNKLKEELEPDDYHMQYDYLSSSDPGILFLGSLGRFMELRELGYKMFALDKIQYLLQTGDLSQEEKNEWKKRALDSKGYVDAISKYESGLVQSSKHYAYNHYINMIYAADRQHGYAYIAFPDGWEEDITHMDFAKPISRDALFGLINRLLLGVSEDYIESRRFARSNDGESEYVETNYLETQDIEALIATNLLSGSGSGSGNAKLNLDKSLTRAELATMANRVFDYLETHQ